MSCCGKNNGNFYTRPGNNYVAGVNSPYNNYVAGATNPCCVQDKCGCANDCCCDTNYGYGSPVGVAGISSPCYNNNDLPCECSLREVARRLTNQRVIIHINGCKMCVIIIGVGCCFLKAVNFTTNKVIYFNLNRIDDIEDVLPRC